MSRSIRFFNPFLAQENTIMGQGYYMALAFGVLDPPKIDEEEGEAATWTYDAAIKKAAGRRVHTAYESERAYMAIFVAENAGVDDNAGTPKTCALADAASGPEWDEAREIWTRIQEASGKLGFPLSDGQPLLIVDCD
jgi:hypothetical protein